MKNPVRLKPEQVIKVADDYGAGLSIREIAEALGVTYGHISRILSGALWPNVQRRIFSRSERHPQKVWCTHRAATVRGRWPEYDCWRAMRKRCSNPNDSAFANYGGRGIAVCDRWAGSFENFIADMGRKPSRRHSIDRIDPSGDYSPENCRWASTTLQANNKRNTLFVEFNGVRKTISEWSAETGLSYVTIVRRIKRGWTAEATLSLPYLSRPKVESYLRGERNTHAKLTADDVRQILACRGTSTAVLAAKYGVGRGTVQRIFKGESWRHLTEEPEGEVA